MLEPGGGLVQSAGSLGDIGQRLEGNDILGIKFEGAAERHLSFCVLLEVEATPPPDDVAGDVPRVAFEANSQDLHGLVVLPVFAVQLGKWSERGALGIFVPLALQLLDFPGIRHPGARP